MKVHCVLKGDERVIEGSSVLWSRAEKNEELEDKTFRG